MKTTPTPQLGPALALVELLREFPGLPELDWTISPRGGLRGSLFGLEDLAAVAGPLVDALGGSAYESSFTSGRDGLPHPVVHIDAVWRDVRVEVSLGGATPVSAKPAVSAGLPAAWSAKAVA